MRVVGSALHHSERKENMNVQTSSAIARLTLRVVRISLAGASKQESGHGRSCDLFNFFFF